MKREIVGVMERIKLTSANHQKNIAVLVNLYRIRDPDEFLQIFKRMLLIVFSHPKEHDSEITRSLEFCAKFTAELTKIQNNESETHPFLSGIVNEVLKYTNIKATLHRQRSCQFIMLVLQNIGEDLHLDVDICDNIQSAMLERCKDPKVTIRQQAIASLTRLQEPQNFDCPVIGAYISALLDCNAGVRRQVIQVIASCNITVNKIKDRVRDVDHSVRTAAFNKCADIGPKSFKIVDRRMILTCGFHESVEVTQRAFFLNLVARWLTAYHGNFLALIAGLKLTSLDEDMAEMVALTNKLMDEFYKRYPLDELTAVLPLDKDEKLVDPSDLTCEVALYWNVLSRLLQKEEEKGTDDLRSQILPELTGFCNYILSYVQSQNPDTLEGWKEMDFQFNVFNLLEMVEHYDFSDQAGRMNMSKVMTKLLQTYEFSEKPLKKIVLLLSQCSSGAGQFTNDVCEILAEIREPLVDIPLTKDEMRVHNFKVSQVKVKLNVLEEEREDALRRRDFAQAQTIVDEMGLQREQLRELEDQAAHGEQVRKTRNDDHTVCRCLDILTAVMQLGAVARLSPSLASARDEFVVPLIGPDRSLDVHWRLIRALGLLCIIDRETATRFAKVVSIPMATYRVLPNFHPPSMVQSIHGVSDLLRLYGIEIISPDQTSQTSLRSSSSNTSSTTSTLNNTTMRRKLYNADGDDLAAQAATESSDSMTLTTIYEIYLDMLDDESDEVRNAAVEALVKLILDDFPVTASFISRIILKWYNPLTEKHDIRMQMKLGLLIERFTPRDNAKQTIMGAVIPTLSALANAPRNSPLVDVDVDNVLLFFSAIINDDEEKELSRMLAEKALAKIAKDHSHKVVPSLGKLLNRLDVPVDNVDTLNQLIATAQNLLVEDLIDKNTKKHIEKFVQTLREHLTGLTTAEIDADIDETTSDNEKEGETETGTIPSTGVTEATIDGGEETNKEGDAASKEGEETNKETGQLNEEKEKGQSNKNARKLRNSRSKKPRLSLDSDQVTNGSVETAKESEESSPEKRTNVANGQVNKDKVQSSTNENSNKKRNTRSKRPRLSLNVDQNNTLNRTALEPIIEENLQALHISDSFNDTTSSSTSAKRSASDTPDTDKSNKSPSLRRSVRAQKKRRIESK